MNVEQQILEALAAHPHPETVKEIRLGLACYRDFIAEVRAREHTYVYGPSPKPAGVEIRVTVDFDHIATIELVAE